VITSPEESTKVKPLITADLFGAIDADNDDLLLKCFEDHDAYRDVRAQSKYLIIGRKGSGKTAIYKILLTEQQSTYFSFGHTFTDYPWQHHDLQARVGVPEADRFTHSWKYLILLSLSKIILNMDQAIPFDDDSLSGSARIEKFIIDTYGSRDPDVTQLFTPSKRLHLKPHFDIDFKLLKFGVSPESVPMNELPTIVQEINQNLLGYVLACLHPDHEYFVCFDQLDLGFDPNKPDYSNRLIGLLLAARDINLAARAAKRRALIAIFLRDDIYDELHFEDKNKITENFSATIEWDAPPRTDKTLRALMGKRFEAVLANDADETVSWEQVFDETKQMPGHQTKYGHILDRTYRRPRDIIRFCNAVLKQYKRRSGEGPFENIDINKARPEYSEYLLGELDDEVHKHLPNYSLYLDVLRAVGLWQFSLQEFQGAWSTQLLGTAVELNAKVALKELYDFSIVGFYRAGGKGYGGSEYVFRYKEPRTAFDQGSARFRVHPGLSDVLGLKRFTMSEGANAKSQEEPIE
jgi:hypothetical protein